MTNSLKLSAEARADFNKEKARIKEDQEWQKKALVDKWMQDAAMVENAMLKAIQEVSGDFSLLIAESSECPLPETAHYLQSKAMELLLAQIRKELEEQADEHLYG